MSMHVPSISFDVKYNSKPRQLVMTKGGIHCRKKDNWRSEDWSASVSNLVRVVPHPEKKSSVQIVVITTHEVDASDAQQALRILGAARNLNLGQEKERKTQQESSKRRITEMRNGQQSSSSTGQKDSLRKAAKSDFEIIRPIGKGSFGEVSLVRHVRTRQTYAMKVMKKMDCEELYDDVYSEKKILAVLSHPFIVRMHFWFEDHEYLFYILDYVPGGELFHHLQRRGRFTEPQARFYMAEIVLALEYLHKDGIVYRDLKPENLLLDSDGHLKVTDFGLSKSGITSAGGGAQTFCGTPQYLAPEILRGAEHGTAVDWWSAGVVLFEMVTGSTPFQSANRKEMYTKVVKGQISFPYFVSIPCKALIRGLLVRRPQDRLGSGPLGVNEIKHQPFFASVDWDGLLRKQVPAPYVPSREEISSPQRLGFRVTRGGKDEGSMAMGSTRMRTGGALARLRNDKASIRSSEVAGISHRLDSLLKSISKSTDSPKHQKEQEGVGRGDGIFSVDVKKSHALSSQTRGNMSRRGNLDLQNSRSGMLGVSTMRNSGTWTNKRDGSGSSGSDSWLNGLKGESGGKKSPTSNPTIDNVLLGMLDS